MKPVFLAFFLLLALSTTLPSTIADDLVYDTDGEPVTNAGSYHIIPVFRGRGGGLELGITGNETCPLTVVQAASELNPGLSVQLTLPEFSLRVFDIGVGQSVGISFVRTPNCVPIPSHWVVVEEFPIGWSVELAKAERSGGPFKIEKYDKYGPNDYKLVYCHDVNVCADLGIHNRRLVVSDGNPLIVHFKKAILSSAARNIVG